LAFHRPPPHPGFQLLPRRGPHHGGCLGNSIESVCRVYLQMAIPFE
jgi:hypothetical protein